jgi:hypothetical protein
MLDHLSELTKEEYPKNHGIRERESGERQGRRKYG